MRKAETFTKTEKTSRIDGLITWKFDKYIQTQSLYKGISALEEYLYKQVSYGERMRKD